MSAEIDRDIAEPEDLDNEETNEAGESEKSDLTQGKTPAQALADDETRSPEEEGGEDTKS